MATSRNRIIDLAKKRVPPKRIAHLLNVDQDKVYAAIRWARSNGVDIPHFRAGSPVGPEKNAETPRPSTPLIRINNRLSALLNREAERAGVTPSEMAQRLLETALLKTVGH